MVPINTITVLSFFTLLLILAMTFMYKDKFQTAFRIVARQTPFNFLRIIIFRFGGVGIGNRVIVNRGVGISKKVRIGDGCVIEKNSKLGFETSLLQNVVIEDNVIIRMAEIGENTIVHSGTKMWGSLNQKLKIGKNCTIGYYSILDGSDNLEIGNFVHLASPSVGIWTHSSINNALKGIKITDEDYSKNQILAPVKIGSHVWIGGKTTIYPGVTLNDFSVILPNSAVNKDVEVGSLVGGVPAKYIKSTKEFRLDEGTENN